MDMANQALLPEQAIRASMYFWWLAFLRCSKDYWWCCQQQGQCQDERLVANWQSFGDIFEYDSFVHWWQVQGAKLFDSPQIEIEFNLLPLGLEWIFAADLKIPRPNMLCLAIPLYLNTDQAKLAILTVWQLARVRGNHYIRDAKFQLMGSEIKSRRMMIAAYRTFALSTIVKQSAVSEACHNWGNYEMGIHLGLSNTNKPKPKDSIAVTRTKQKHIRTLFSQHKRAASDFIANVEIGRFPCKDPVEVKPRWNSRQQSALDQAVLEGRWQSPHWLAHEHAFMLLEPDLLSELNRYSEIKPLALLADFASLRTPFLEPKRIRKRN